ncbi:hypothetical protein RB195_026161 [Necator americanus]|uniref:Uncharacterized protein n=1 Tax=Necator americanus TaxID=51031 RepID=A0ABR1EY04_NECAM
MPASHPECPPHSFDDILTFEALINSNPSKFEMILTRFLRGPVCKTNYSKGQKKNPYKFRNQIYSPERQTDHLFRQSKSMKVLVLFLLWVDFARIYGEEAFTCDDTGEECPTKMCFYGIDHEHSCYRAGCDTKEQCKGRRHNECFIGNGLHTCCCMERGCAASYKGLSDCVDDPKNSTEPNDITTSVTDVATEEENAGSEKEELTTESYTLPAATDVPVTSAEVVLTTTTTAATTTETLSTTSEADEITTAWRGTTLAAISTASKEEETSTEAARTSTEAIRTSTEAVQTSTEPIRTSTEAIRTSTEAIQTSIATDRTTSSPTPSRETTTTRGETTTSRTTHPVIVATRTTTVYTPRTTRYTTTQIHDETTTAQIEEFRLLPDMPHVQKQTDPPEQSSTEKKQLTTSSMRTTTQRFTTTPVRTIPPAINEPIVEPSSELEPARTEKSHLISTAKNLDEEPESDPPTISSEEYEEEENSTQTNGEKIDTSSLISVYEVTTLAVKNREEQWKPSVPWWAAVAMGFLVSVIVAWAVVFLLRKKKLREAESANRKSADKEAAVADPLLKPTEIPDN